MYSSKHAIGIAPKVSVIINNFNYSRFLRVAIESALDQSYKNKEVIVVDDGSMDDSKGIIKSFGNSLIPVFKDNGGQASAINAGFRVAKGEYIFLLDADDYWVPKKIDLCMEQFLADEGCGFVQHNMIEVDEDSKEIGLLKKQRLPSGRLDFNRAFSMNYALAPTSGSGFKREVFERILDVPEDIFRVRADYYLQTMAILNSKLASIDAPLGYYRIHGKNLYSGRLTGDKIKKDMELISSYNIYLKERFGIKARMHENYYFVRGSLYLGRKSKKLFKPLTDFFMHIPALVRGEVSFKTKVFRLFVFIAILVNAEFGLDLFNRIVSYYRGRK
ncbi:MAG: glycosyltransferase [Nitrospirota bacterium]